ncbi:MAG: glycosyltransferase [Thermoproteota archaeon]
MVPQLRIRGRYQEWYPEYWLVEARKYFTEVKSILPMNEVYEKTNYFTNVEMALKNELLQILALSTVELRKDDIVFWLDIDFPGFIYPFTFFLKRHGVKVYGILHGYYRNPGDVWEGVERGEHYLGCIKNMDGIFVGTESFKRLILDDLQLDYILPDKIHVTGLPFFSKNFIKFRRYRKYMDVVMDRTDMSKEDYEEILKYAKYVIIGKRSETFGYTLLELLASGSKVACPDDIPVYREWKEKFGDGILLYDRYNYSEQELFDRLRELDVVRIDHKVFKYLEESAKRIFSIMLGEARQ